VLGNTKNLPLVLPHQLIERGQITSPCALDQRYVGVDLLAFWGLDG
jgi:hypothetical protein